MGEGLLAGNGLQYGYLGGYPPLSDGTRESIPTRLTLSKEY
jgi:hypothetical protein